MAQKYKKTKKVAKKYAKRISKKNSQRLSQFTVNTGKRMINWNKK